MKNRIIKFFYKKWIIFVIIILAIFKQLTVVNVKEFFDFGMICDDRLMVNYAINLNNNDYLGEYNYITLIKGIGFSLFLAFLYLIKASYPMAFTLLNTISIIYFIYALKDVFKNKISLLILYIVMLFNPILYDYDTLARLYNTGIQTFQVNFIIAGYFILLTRREKSKKYLLLHSSIVSFFIAWFYINRTDSIYILPFTIFATTVIIFKSCPKSKKSWNFVFRLLIVILPLISMITAKNIIINLNNKYYGTKIYNEYTDSNSYFNKFLKQLNSIKSEKNVEYSTNTNEKMKKIFEVSPTLQVIEEEYLKNAKRWDYFDRNAGDGEVEDGWFYWCIKETYHLVKNPKNAKESNNYWKKVTNEIDTAINDNKFEMQLSFPMMISPWKKGYGIKLLKSSFELLTYSIRFEDIDISYNLNTNFSIVQENFIKFIYYIYKFCNPILFIISILIYRYILIKFLEDKKDDKKFYITLLLTALILNITLVIIGMAYTHISAFSTQKVTYLTLVYNFMVPFIFISLLYFIENFNFKKL